jgi:CHAD domain-containing protein
MLERATKTLTLNFAGVLAGESEAIHQFRISVLRLRGLIELYQPLLHQNWFNRHREELRFFGHSVGALRDSDVLQQNLSDAAVKLDESFCEALAPLHRALAARRQQQHDEARALLQSPRYEALVNSLPSGTFKRVSSPDGRLTPAELIQPLVRTVERAGAKLTRRASPIEFHRLRVKIKRLRYALEMLDGGKSKHAKTAVKKLKSAQEILGLQHDLVTTMGWLREVAGSAAIPGPSLLAGGAAYEVLRRQSLKLSRRGWKKWRAVRAGGALHDLVTGLPDSAPGGTKWSRRAEALSAAQGNESARHVLNNHGQQQP